MITVEVKDDITPKLNAMADSVGTLLQNMIEETAEALTPFLQQNAPVGKHYTLDGTLVPGGELRDSLHFVIGQWGAYLSGAKQGIFVAAGTKPHVIAASRAPHLAFFWEKLGHAVYPHSVNHPGQKANDFRDKALQQAMDEMVIQDLLNRNMAQWVSQSG